MESGRYLVIHGHFYQPPRENPWILAIEPQDSAAPYANWNLRINRECYAPNSRARLLGTDGLIRRVINNYERLSFNFGPTLLSWLEKADSDTYHQLIAADRRAAEAHDGHGPALAQVYNHIIMPLANPRDRLTQIRWGLIDFETRFGRRPEGQWLAETAADLETLKMLAGEGVKFTILSQGQAAAVRPLAAAKRGDDTPWCDVTGGRIDPREPYRVVWGPGPDDGLDVFFYDGPVSRAIAFEKLLRDGSTLLGRVEQAFGEPLAGGGPRLVNLATDGESYGHHFAFGDMALAWLFDHLETQAGEAEAIRLTNYGQYLALFPPTKEVRIIDNTSWSCVHGVERWRSDCGCNTGGGNGHWNQKWRRPLREGFDWLRDRLAEIFERRGRELLTDPWAARDDYIRVVIADYRPEALDEFFRAHRARELDGAEISRALALLESQLMGLYMFTSCGWFFDEISGLEPVQNLRYSLRAIELAQPFAETDLTRGLENFLETIVPNDPEYATGLEVWRKMVVPDSLDRRTLAAHWAASTLLDVPEVLDFFETPRFNSRTVTRLKGEGLDIMAASVDLFDRRLARADTHLCLAIYSGSTHLAILAGEPGPETAGAAPDWLDEHKLRAYLGERLKAPAALSIWDFMLGLMPLTSRFVIEDFLPYCRAALLSALVDDVYDDLKARARDLFHLHQHLLMTKRAAGQPITWVERFIFRVMGETELQRILGPAEFDRPINLGALTNLLNKRGLVGLAKEEPIVAELGQVFFQNVFRSLAEARALRQHLTEILNFIKLIRQEGFRFDLWGSQNQWYALYLDPIFSARLSPEEQNLMRELGEALGFSPDLRV